MPRVAGETESVECPTVAVKNADYANCNGVYKYVSNIHVTWAPQRPVYKHKTKNR